MRQEGALKAEGSLSRQTLGRKEMLKGLRFYNFTSLHPQNGAENLSQADALSPFSRTGTEAQRGTAKSLAGQ